MKVQDRKKYAHFPFFAGSAAKTLNAPRLSFDLLRKNEREREREREKNRSGYDRGVCD